MKLIAITKPFNEGTIWVNPEYVLCVQGTYIGHKSEGVRGTKISVKGLEPIKTNEAIGSVIERLQGGQS